MIGAITKFGNEVISFILRSYQNVYRVFMMKKIFAFLVFVSCFVVNSAYSADCVAVGQRIAAEQNGRLARSTPVVQKGREMCVVVVLIDGSNGEKPRRVEVAVPAN